MKYTWEQISWCFRIYASEEFGNRNSFVNRLKEEKIPEEEACLMWQGFDMAVEQCWMFLDKESWIATMRGSNDENRN